jgi:hypothetical protein
MRVETGPMPELIHARGIEVIVSLEDPFVAIKNGQTPFPIGLGGNATLSPELLSIPVYRVTLISRIWSPWKCSNSPRMPT